MESLFASLATIVAVIPAILVCAAIFLAGWGYYKKVKNDTRMILYNKTYDAYRPYSNLLFTYINQININQINADDNFNINNPQYKEAQQKLLYASGETVLLADNNVRTQISRFIDYSLATSNNPETSHNQDEAKKEFLEQLFSLQKAIKNHLDEIQPVIT